MKLIDIDDGLIPIEWIENKIADIKERPDDDISDYDQLKISEVWQWLLNDWRREMNEEKFENGEYFIYVNGDKYELGKVKRPNNSGTGYFCYYHEGSTCANTPTDKMHKLANAYVIKEDNFGRADKE